MMQNPQHPTLANLPSDPMEAILAIARRNGIAIAYIDRETFEADFGRAFTDEEWAKVSPYTDDYDEWVCESFDVQSDYITRVLDRAGLTRPDEEPADGDEEDGKCGLDCARHAPGCDGYCDHLDGHRNACRVAQEQNSLRITAQVHSDDRGREVTFDATAFFKQASTDQLEELVQCGFGGDYAADEIAWYYQELNPEVRELLAYVHSQGGIGFEVRVNAEEARAWLAANRPDIALS